MNRNALFFFAVIAAVSLAGCTQPAEAPTAEASAPEVATPAPAAAEPAPAPVPEPEPEPQIAMPDGLPAVVHVYPQVNVTEVTTVDAATNQFVIKGETRSSTVQVLNYYIDYFRKNAWEEDMIMEQHGNTVISFHKDGILQYVESNEGGPGSFVTITVGNY